MKVSVLGISIAWGGFWGVAAYSFSSNELIGIGSVPYDLVNQLCLGLLPPSFIGAIVAYAFGFSMGVGTGIFWGVVYNIISGIME